MLCHIYFSSIQLVQQGMRAHTVIVSRTVFFGSGLSFRLYFSKCTVIFDCIVFYPAATLDPETQKFT